MVTFLLLARKAPTPVSSDLLAVLNVSSRGTKQKVPCCIAMPKKFVLVEFAAVLALCLTRHKTENCALGVNSAQTERLFW